MPDKKPDKNAVAALAAAVAEAERYPIRTGGGRGVVTCGGACYCYGVYVLAGMLRAVGYKGPIQVWHLGDDEPLPCGPLEQFDVETVDTVALAAAEKLLFPTDPTGWSTKSFAVSRSPFDVVFFFDADAYPVAPIENAFGEGESTGELFWAETPNDHLKWEKFGREPSPKHHSINAGQWVINKRKRRRELGVYCGLNDRWPVVYPHTFGDQDCQPLAWSTCGTPYRAINPPGRMVGSSLVFDYPVGTPFVVHRVLSKFAPAGCFDPMVMFTGPVRGLPLEREAIRLYRDALDAFGVPAQTRSA